MKIKPQEYTFSIAAHSHLATLFILKHSTSTHYRRQSVPVYDGLYVQHETETHQQQQQGIAHSLNVLAMHTDITEWQDTRPPQVIQQHEQEMAPPAYTANPNSTYTVQDARTYLKHRLTPTYKARWYIPYDHYYMDNLDDTPWDEVPAWEQKERLDMKLRLRHVYTLSLQPYTRMLLYLLAQRNHMETLNRRAHSETAYISAALEAIGTGWLSPPQDYQELLLDPLMINRNKLRSQSHQTQTRKSGQSRFGNHEGTPFLITQPPEIAFRMDPEQARLINPLTNPDYVFTEHDLKFYTLQKNEPLIERARAYILQAQQLKEKEASNTVVDPSNTVVGNTAITPITPPKVHSSRNPNRDTPARASYYKSITKLTPEQVDQAYTLYYNTPTPPKPSYKSLALLFNVSPNTIFRALHVEHLARTGHMTTQPKSRILSES